MAMHPPFARGVSHLMYVGDDAETAPQPSSTEKIAGVLGVWAALEGRGILRLAGIGVASWVAYKTFRK